MRTEIIILIMVVAVVAICLLAVKVLIPRQIVRVMESYQNDLVGRQFEEIQNAYREMRGWRHDYNNHMQVLTL